MKIDPKLVEEWADSPVTRHLLQYVLTELEEILESRGVNAFVPDNPQRTQEILVRLNGNREILLNMQEALQGNPIYFSDDEEEDDEDSEAVLE